MFIIFLCFFFLSYFTYKWYHRVFVFLWLISFNIIPFKSIHIAENGKIFFLWLSISLCVCIHIFIIHLSVNGHSGCFHILAIVSNVAMNISVHVPFGTGISVLDLPLGMKFMGHIVVLFLAFWETSILFSIVTTPIYIPINSARGSPFPHILTNTCYMYFFGDSHSDW